MLWAMPSAPHQIQRMAILCVGTFAVLNAVFYVLSGSYFESHHQMVPGVGAMPAYSPEQATHVRVTFAVASGVVTAFAFAGGVWRRGTGHLLPALLGLGHLAGAVAAYVGNAPGVLPVVLFVSGVLMPVLAVYSYRGSRAAWAFLISMCGVFAVVGLFGAPKIKAGLDVGLWTAMILPGLYVVAATSLALLRDEYLDRGSTPA